MASFFKLAGIRSAAALLVILCATQHSSAIDIPWQGTTGSYSDGANWEGGSSPYGSFGDGALINNGGTAIVNDAPISPAWVVLGRNAGNSGSLVVESTGNLAIDGPLEVGRIGGFGHLTVRQGGALSANSILGAGTSDSGIVLGEPSGGETAQLTINGPVTLSRTTRIVGPNVAFQADSLSFNFNHRLVADLTAPSHSPIQVAGAAVLDGALQVDATGFAPTVGQSWTLIDAESISGNFSEVTSNAPLAPGLGFVVTRQAGGAHGEVVQLSVGVELAVTVDRRSGNVSLINRSSHGLAIDGYLLTSSTNVLNPAGWNSFQSSGLNDWRESNPSSNHLGELNLTGSRTIGPQSAINLGSAYSFPPTALGESNQDVTFEYRVANGQKYSGKVEFTGLHNNIVLLVDPATGEAAIQNQSTYDLSIDGYLITSESGALSTNGWTSLADSGQSDWRESNPSANHLGELNIDSEQFLPGTGGRIALGTPFVPQSAEDLVFEFRLTEGETMTGIVEYGPLTALAGDFNWDGVVDAADYVVWRNSLGQTGVGLPADGNGDFVVDADDYTHWKLNYGQTVSGAALMNTAVQSVPEPASWAVLAFVSLAIAGRHYCRGSANAD